MTDWEKLVAKTTTSFYVETVTTKKVCYNKLGERIDENVITNSTLYIFDEENGKWVKGLSGDEE